MLHLSLICSDLIARGIDLDLVDTVISYDVPLYMKKYVHRVGRTARAGREGDAYTLVETQEARHFKEMLGKAGHLEKVKKVNVKEEVLGGLVEAYQQSLTDLKSVVTNARPSVARYQSSMVAVAGNDGEEGELVGDYGEEEGGGMHIRFDDEE
ncbi:P-loop containing nucleoside triphosphate hydrolase protein [Jimgerdemannia flammicorona]|uniref:RNA helicase n=1 Tax=Jimgerdemannia flammicorona TaxID=994334 RepID=A0A433A1W9_9FUNG|nr:P-loop containing nucleoside triphosphate hydrolase protein [Jimgerdemannia flammicorona]